MKYEEPKPQEMKIDVLEIFKMGIDYGQLLMEEERDNEDLFDAFQGYLIDQKHSMPSQPVPRRLPRSDNWRNAKKKSLYDFMEILVNVRTKPEQLKI